jgi:hypothetical protein
VDAARVVEEDRAGGGGALVEGEDEVRHACIVARSKEQVASSGQWTVDSGGGWNMELGTWNWEHGTWNLELGTWNRPAVR